MAVLVKLVTKKSTLIKDCWRAKNLLINMKIHKKNLIPDPMGI